MDMPGKEKVIKEGLEVKQDDNQIEISADSGDYSGEIENGKVSFSVFYDNMEDIENEFGPEGITSENWKDVLGPNHAFVKIIDTIGGDVEAIDDYVQITVDVDKLVNSGIREGIEGKFDSEDNIYTYDHLINTDIPVGKDLKTVLLAIKKDQEELNKQGKKTKVVKGDTVPYLELKEANARTEDFKENKISKIKEALKKALKETNLDAERDKTRNLAIATEKQKIKTLQAQKTSINADKTKNPAEKSNAIKDMDTRLRTAQDTLNKLNSNQIELT